VTLKQRVMITCTTHSFSNIVTYAQMMTWSSREIETILSH